MATTKKTQDIQYYEAVGRRKSAVARVRLYITGKDKTATIKNNKVKQGTILINQKNHSEIFTGSVEQKKIGLPFELTNNTDRFVTSIHVEGGGQNGQLEAIMHGVSRALCLVDNDEYRPILKEYEFLTRDPRKKERRKVGTGGKARRAKQSPKR